MRQSRHRYRLRTSAPPSAPPPSGGAPTVLSDRVNRDPVAVLVALLEAGLSPEQVWPAASNGFQLLLHAKRLTPKGGGPGPGKPRPSAQQDAQRIIRQQLDGDPSAPQTAIRAHPAREAWIEAAQRTICTPAWVEQPWLARVICASHEEAREIESLLRQDPEPGRSEDQLEAAYWIAENLHQPGAVLPRVPPVALADEVPEGAQLQEVFLSPGCRSLTAEQLLPVVRAARMGLHVVG